MGELTNVDELLSQLDEPECGLLGCPPEGAPPARTGEAGVAAQIQAPDPVVDVRKHVQRHEAIADEILSSWRADRTEAQDAIALIRGLIDDTIAKGSNPTGTVLEVYVGAIRAKSDTNANAIKLLDATAKLLATTKSNINIRNTQHNTIVGDLDALLADPIRDDDV